MANRMLCPDCGKLTDGKCCLGFAQRKLRTRQARLARLEKLNAPQNLLDNERDLIRRAEEEIREFEAPNDPN
jgi:hypothetical protein